MMTGFLLFRDVEPLNGPLYKNSGSVLFVGIGLFTKPLEPVVKMVPAFHSLPFQIVPDPSSHFVKSANHDYSTMLFPRKPNLNFLP